eukprot:GHRQ01006361.1.p1 GENE.GHRQ01006361.1~~GHRQ01006361.1.p1  ORF type:complete len:294 (+),score=98.79 GHRQ01006361.1:156-1037(+)
MALLSQLLRPSLIQSELASLSRVAGNARNFAGEAGLTAAATPPSSASGSTQQSEPEYSGPPKLVVFGGRGFVGSAVCKQALNTGLHVVAISPSGTPPTGKEPWTREVEWLRGNALEPRTYQDVLHGALAAISCVGGFGSQADMLRINGAANAAAIATARAAGVPRFVYISAHTPPMPGIDMVLSGYIQGKRQAEEELLRSYPQSGVVLRPWLIYGDRAISSHVSLPLGMLFSPVEYALRHIPNAKQLAQLPFVGAGFIPPVPVEQVAKVAVAAATDPSVPGGIIDDWNISEWK